MITLTVYNHNVCSLSSVISDICLIVIDYTHVNRLHHLNYYKYFLTYIIFINLLKGDICTFFYPINIQYATFNCNICSCQTYMLCFVYCFNAHIISEILMFVFFKSINDEYIFSHYLID